MRAYSRGVTEMPEPSNGRPPGGKPSNGKPKLSRREIQVVEMALLGLTNGQIAARLRVTPHAIKFHLASIYRKLDVHTRTEAAVAYLRASSEGN
jgi:DNA-binding NarL/FixJ family response regulator